jgi:hypothetical protein
VIMAVRMYGLRVFTAKSCQSAFKFGSDAILVQLRLFCAD